ncbi:hypothetical protein WJX77_000462 [Trebouxia sp. C0004]
MSANSNQLHVYCNLQWKALRLNTSECFGQDLAAANPGMSNTLKDKRAATEAVKRLGLQTDLRARAVVLVAADSTVGNSLRVLIQLNEDDPGLKALVEEFLRGEGTGPRNAWREEYKRDIAQLDTNLRALINRPSIISTTTLQELGALANKKPKNGCDLGASIQVVGLLGFGATSHVYEALEGGQQVVAKVPFRPQNLSQECAVLQSLQGIAGIPNLLHDQCVGDSILMRPVLDPLAPGAFFVYNLHNSLPTLVQMLKAAHCKLVINRDVRPNNLMHTQSQIYLVDWGSATLQQNAPYEGWSPVSFSVWGITATRTQAACRNPRR